MTRKTLSRYRCLLLAVVGGSLTLADVPALGTRPAATQAATVPQVERFSTDFWPDLSWPTVCWFGAIALFAVTVRQKPLASVRNFDALVLAGMCLLLALRGAPGGSSEATQSRLWWPYLGLTLAVAYWLVRGIWLLAARQPARQPHRPFAAMQAVLLGVGLALCIHQLATAPISSGSRDAIVGGLFTAAHGKLPYGDVEGFDSRSPLLYLLHAGALKLVPPTIPRPAEGLSRVAMTWENREEWLAEPWLESADLAAARLVNGLLFVGVVVGLYLIGCRLQGSTGGWMMAALFCLFPGTLECLPQPDIMLPTLLLTWAVVLTLLPGIGGVLATFCLVLAGVAWPWAWLGLPILLAYFWRRGWQAAASTAGLAAGAVLCLFACDWLVQPTIPRASGALRMAGLQPLYEAHLAYEDTLVIHRREVSEEQTESPAISYYLWRPLVEAGSVSLRDTSSVGSALKVDWPNGVNGRTVLYRQVHPTDQARPVLQAAYRSAVGATPRLTRQLVGLRTVLEAAWVPAHYREPPLIGTWRLWGGPPPMDADWVLIRRLVKALVALVVIWASLAIFFGRRLETRHLLAALLAATSGSLLASELGGVTYLVWVLPLLTSLWALDELPQPRPTGPAPVPTAVPFDIPPPPRISVEPRPGQTRPD